MCSHMCPNPSIKPSLVVTMSASCRAWERDLRSWERDMARDAVETSDDEADEDRAHESVEESAAILGNMIVDLNFLAF